MTCKSCGGFGSMGVAYGSIEEPLCWRCYFMVISFLLFAETHRARRLY